ncbi:hypothetical protein QJS04_geneDACA006025 [Acorus gramineus]|uniref:Glutaredoxin domain-containing protein n=1 Tax=Acorus gramineus TaxID=55184 RepID=A0AAV9B156_ACOGR|nr:hypothetical protein QJS04_geneDACA006025 [Acorus gramineus]
MWPPWGRRRSSASTRRVPPPSPPNPSFSFSTFKDIEALLADDQPRKPLLHRLRSSASTPSSPRSLLRRLSAPPDFHLPPSPSDKRIVVYFTSLRVVRKTFEDCRTVRSILRGFRLSIDERDLSMDSGFLKELQSILGGGGKSAVLSLPRVFIGGRYVGGAEEIRQMHEAGELKRVVEGVAPEVAGTCDVCGGFRFVLCGKCDGSHKCYSDKGRGFRSCTACNENGLIRCPDCSPPILTV